LSAVRLRGFWGQAHPVGYPSIPSAPAQPTAKDRARNARLRVFPRDVLPHAPTVVGTIDGTHLSTGGALKMAHGFKGRNW